MSEDSQLDQKKEKIRQLLKDAVPAQQATSESGGDQSCDHCSRRLKFLSFLFISCLIGTMFPHATANTSFSIAAIACGLTLWLTRRTNPAPVIKKLKMTFALLVGLSLLSGCSPALFRGENAEILELCKEEETCKVGVAQGIAILGFEIKPASIELAQQNGNITKVRAAEVREGFGLVRLAQVRVYGE